MLSERPRWVLPEIGAERDEQISLSIELGEQLCERRLDAVEVGWCRDETCASVRSIVDHQLGLGTTLWPWSRLNDPLEVRTRHRLSGAVECVGVVRQLSSPWLGGIGGV